MDILIGIPLSDFFFQAEDGIRGVAVTGVQTCALPIWSASSPDAVDRLSREALQPTGASAAACRTQRRTVRSEERRVGKECRARRMP